MNIQKVKSGRRTYRYFRLQNGKKVQTFPKTTKGEKEAKRAQWSFQFLSLLAQGETLFPDRNGYNTTVTSLLRKARINGSNICFKLTDVNNLPEQIQK